MPAMFESSTESYLDQLSSKSSTPGGGAVAAITGAQAVALIAMVCEFTKPSTKSSTEDQAQFIKGLLHKANQAKKEFLVLADRDVAGFSRLMSSFRLAKTTPDEKATRLSEIQAALIEALTPPLEMLLLAASFQADLGRLETVGNQNLITDTGIAALLLDATISAAEMNVLVNLNAVSDQAYRTATLKRIEAAKSCQADFAQIATNISGILRS